MGGVILSGVQYLHWGVLHPLMVAVGSRMAYSMMRRFIREGEIRLTKTLAASLGRSAESLGRLVRQLCQTTTLASTRATFVTGTEFYPRHVQRWAPRPDARVALWCGGKEQNMGRAERELRRAFPNLTVHVFEGMGHGENAEHPEMVVREIKAFMGW